MRDARITLLTVSRSLTYPARIALFMLFFGFLCGIRPATAAQCELGVSANKHFLVRRDTGEPFCWTGDTGWSIFGRYTTSEATQYLDHRAQHKFNVIQTFFSAGWMTTDRAGNKIFLNGSALQPNPAYLAHVDEIIDMAETRGLFVCLGIGEVIRNDSPWYITSTADGYAYGRILGNHFRTRTKVIWSMGQDFDALSDGLDYRPVIRAVAEGVADGVNGVNSHDGAADYSTTLMTYHASTRSSRWFHNDAWLDFNMIQTWKHVKNIYSNLNGDYNLTPPKPTVHAEGAYEGATDIDGNPITPHRARYQAYWAVFAGAEGHTYGHTSIWPHRSSWSSALNAAGGLSIKHLRALLQSRSILNRQPDQSVITSTLGSTSDGSFRAACRASDNSYVFVYTTKGYSFTVDMTKVSGSAANAWWYNPRNGKCYDANGSETTSPFGQYATSGARTFDPPGGTGDDMDWVLVLDDTARDVPVPGTGTYGAPQVMLTAPAQDSFYQAPVDIVIEADASDFDGTVSTVAFYAGSEKLGERSAPPYRLTWTDAPAGRHTLHAEATDNEGFIGKSASAQIQVYAEAVAFVAYNDLCWAAAQQAENITTYTRTQSGPLCDYLSGQSLAAQLSVDAGGSGPLADQGADADSDTDAGRVFNGRVDCRGVISYSDTPVALDFGGLSTDLEYECVVFGNRAEQGYTGRRTRVTLTGADAWLNASTPGAGFADESDPATVIVNGYNTANGYVARWTGIRPGTDGAFTLSISGDGPDSPQFYANAVLLIGSRRTDTGTLVAKQSEWQYNDSGADLGTAWREPDYDDSAWPTGPGVLGYGEPDHIDTTVSYGSNSSDKHITTYFRHSFVLGEDPGTVGRLTLWADYDDGFVAYLNGAEITRQSMPTGPIGSETPALSHEGKVYEEIDVTAHTHKLVQGLNTLAVEVHQVGPSSSDLVWDMALSMEPAPEPQTDTLVANGAQWRYRKGTAEASSPAYHWRTPGFDDSAWPAGNARFGYSSAPDEGPFATTLADMQGNYACVFLRRHFVVDEPSAVAALALRAEYDDGFILWINGQETARENITGAPGGAVAYDEEHAPADSIEPRAWSTTLSGARMPQLRRGTNLLAVQVFNYLRSSSDLVFDASLSVVHYPFSATEDTDQDGLSDAWETDALGGTGADPDGDADSDGVLNIEEYVAGTDPGDETGYLKLENRLQNGRILVELQTVPADGPGYEGRVRHYALEQDFDFGGAGLWTPVAAHADIIGAGQTVVYTNPASSPTAVFRARVWLE